MTVQIAENEVVRASTAYRAAKDDRRQHDDKKARERLGRASVRLRDAHAALERARTKARVIENARRDLMEGTAA